MKEQIPEGGPDKKREVTGLIAHDVRDTVSGADTFYTLSKAGIVIKEVAKTGEVVLKGLQVQAPIMGAAGVGALLYSISAAIDEKVRQRKERRKKQELKEWQDETKKLQEELKSRLESDHRDSSQSENTENLDTYIDIQTFDEGLLLKFLLRDYLKRLGLLKVAPQTASFNAVLKAKKKINGHLPDRNSMISLIEATIPLSRHDPHFAAKVKQYLDKQLLPNLPVDANFGLRVTEALDLGPITSDKNFDLQPQSKPKSKLKRVFGFVRRSLFFISKGTTAYGLVLGCAIILGLAIPGAVFAWPIYVVGAVVAVATAISAYAYKYYVEKKRSETLNKVKKEVEKNKNKYNLLYKINRLRTKEYQDLNKYIPLASLDIPIVSSPKVSFAVRARLAFSRFFQTLYGSGVGTVVGIAVATVSLMLIAVVLPPVGIPLLTINLLGLILGTIYAVRYGRIMWNDARKRAVSEKARIEKVSQLKEDCEERIGLHNVNSRINKSIQELVAELLQAYINFETAKIQGKNSQQAPSIFEEALSEKERLLLKIEKLTGIRRPRDSVTSLPLNDNQKFYNRLSLFLQKDKKIAGNDANKIVTEFSAKVIGKEIFEIKPRASQKFTWNNFKKNAVAFNQWALVNNFYPTVTAVAIGVTLGFMLFGPFALIPVGIVGISVVSVYAAQKFLTYKARQNGEKQIETQTKLELIEAIVKTNQKTAKAIEARKKLPIMNDLDQPAAPASPVIEEKEVVKVEFSEQKRKTHHRAKFQGLFSIPIDKPKVSLPRMHLSDITDLGNVRDKQIVTEDEFLASVSPQPDIEKASFLSNQESQKNVEKLSSLDNPERRRSVKSRTLSNWPWATRKIETFKAAEVNNIPEKQADSATQTKS